MLINCLFLLHRTPHLPMYLLLVTLTISRSQYNEIFWFRPSALCLRMIPILNEVISQILSSLSYNLNRQILPWHPRHRISKDMRGSTCLCWFSHIDPHLHSPWFSRLNSQVLGIGIIRFNLKGINRWEDVSWCSSVQSTDQSPQRTRSSGLSQ